MSAEFAFFLTIVCFGSMWACYRIGIAEERERWITSLRKKKEADE